MPTIDWIKRIFEKRKFKAQEKNPQQSSLSTDRNITIKHIVLRITKKYEFQFFFRCKGLSLWWVSIHPLQLILKYQAKTKSTDFHNSPFEIVKLKY